MGRFDGSWRGGWFRLMVCSVVSAGVFFGGCTPALPSRASDLELNNEVSALKVELVSLNKKLEQLEAERNQNAQLTQAAERLMEEQSRSEARCEAMIKRIPKAVKCPAPKAVACVPPVQTTASDGQASAAPGAPVATSTVAAPRLHSASDIPPANLVPKEGQK